MSKVKFHPEFLSNNKKRTSSGIASVQLRATASLRCFTCGRKILPCEVAPSPPATVLCVPNCLFEVEPPCCLPVAPLSKLIELRGLYWQICGAKIMLMTCFFQEPIPGARNKGIQRYFLLDGYCYRSVQHFGKLLHLVFSALRTSGVYPLGLCPQLSKVIKQEQLRRSQWSESGASERRTKQSQHKPSSSSIHSSTALAQAAILRNLKGMWPYFPRTYSESNINRRPCQTKPKISSMGY